MLLSGLMLCVLHASALCLPEGTTERQNLVNAAGESFPMGLNIGADRVNEVVQLVNTVLKIIIEERLGFNVTVSKIVQANLPILAGCPPHLAQRATESQCINETRVHAIAGSLVNEDDFAGVEARLKDKAPVSLGAVGYESTASFFVSKAVWEDAMTTEGIGLDFYRFWNASWYDPSKYFDAYSSIPKSLLTPCQETLFGDVEEMADYALQSGDTAGLHPNGTAICEDGFWFITPACRWNTSRCVPLAVRTRVDRPLQRSAAYNMPMAITSQIIGRGRSTIPLRHKVLFTWVQPLDDAYLALSPYPVQFPLHDPIAWGKGDFRTMTKLLARKYVSEDLSRLAPKIVELISKMTLATASVNGMMEDSFYSGDSQEDVACRWLLANRDQWENWMPDDTVCLRGFGLYDPDASVFVDERLPDRALTCVACESGRFSKRIRDDRGITYQCSPCAPGSIQPLGGATSCDLCPPGEYQDEPKAIACKRCSIAFYQDERGATACKNCTAGSTTVGPGSISHLDCGCPAGKIETARVGVEASCAVCQQGLMCPKLSTRRSLSEGYSELGIEVPVLEGGYMSTEDEPLEVFKCQGSECPGGSPGSCGGGAKGIVCSQCSPGEYWGGETCRKCENVVAAAWTVAIVVAMLLLPFSKLSRLNIKSPSLATLIFVAVCIWEIGLNLLQTLGIIGQMPLDWPYTIQWSFSFLEFFAFEISDFGFACLVGPDPLVQYSVQTAFVPALLLWVILVHKALKVAPTLQWLRSEGGELLLLLGQLVMMCFEALSNLALVPFMCYQHPNGSYSNLQFASVLCSSREHTVMLLLGGGLLLLVLGFLVACAYALKRLPGWIFEGCNDFALTATAFLTDQFRPDTWWFGLPLLLRGPVLSLIIALFTNEPATQVTVICFALCAYLLLLVLTWPYKYALLNVLEAFASWSMVLVVLGGTMYLPAAAQNSIDFPSVATLCAAALAVIAVYGAFVLTTINLILVAARTKPSEDLRFKFLHLRDLPNVEELAEAFTDAVKQLETLPREEWKKRMSGLSSFDSRLLAACVEMISVELVPLQNKATIGRIPSSNSFRSSSFLARGCSQTASDSDCAETRIDQEIEQQTNEVMVEEVF